MFEFIVQLVTALITYSNLHQRILIFLLFIVPEIQFISVQFLILLAIFIATDFVAFPTNNFILGSPS